MISPMEIFLRQVADEECQMVEKFLRVHPDRVALVHRGWVDNVLTTSVVDGGPAKREYVILKRGLYYRPDKSGYTTKREEAGLYTEAEALIENLAIPEVTYEIASNLDAAGLPRDRG